MADKIQKILALRGVCSRRAAEKLIQQGKVSVNGTVATLGDRAEETDVFEVSGKIIESVSSNLYYMLNKPRGYITTMSDEKGRRTVCDLIDVGVRVHPVGRLDYASEGLLIMTNDGDLTNRLTHPRHDIVKEYLVTVRGEMENALAKLETPIEIDGRLTRPAVVTVMREGSDSGLLSVKISEGRNRQVRRLCEQAGLTVVRLKRICIGPIALGKLPVGKFRELSAHEIDMLKSL